MQQPYMRFRRPVALSCLAKHAKRLVDVDGLLEHASFAQAVLDTLTARKIHKRQLAIPHCAIVVAQRIYMRVMQ